MLSILVTRYNCAFYYLLGKKNWNYKSSFVPDVRTKCSAYLISVSDMCFECETLVSPPAELSVLASPFMSDVHRLPLLRWYPQEVQSCLEESSESGKFLYLEARVIFFFLGERQNSCLEPEGIAQARVSSVRRPQEDQRKMSQVPP